MLITCRLSKLLATAHQIILLQATAELFSSNTMPSQNQYTANVASIHKSLNFFLHLPGITLIFAAL